MTAEMNMVGMVGIEYTDRQISNSQDTSHIFLLADADIATGVHLYQRTY